MWKFALHRLVGPRYQPVATSNVHEESCDATSPTLQDVVRDRDKQRQRTALTFVLSTVCLLASASFFLYRVRHRISDHQCMRRMSAPSPALDAVRFEWVRFADEFEPDLYSGYPSAASEEAWGKLWDFGAFSVPQELLSGLNKSSSAGDFRLVDPQRQDSGVGGLLEGAHQIHCLNLIRQFIYRDHWDYSQLPSFSGGAKTRQHHVDHCIETLRTVLMCLSDVTPYVPTESGALAKVQWRGFPHKCRVYGDLVVS